jgi:hypothetical protein
MRLINLRTFELKEFTDSERPPYIILSHTWGAEEVTLQQLQLDASAHIRKEGYLKIQNFALQGKANGFEWGWVDTCCIDKTSSAELSEAINSMYRWYEEADSCYAYLSDVSSSDVEGQQKLALEKQFAASRWFTRGWTLQELLAPQHVVFYLRDWAVYGSKRSLQKEISRITNISEDAITKVSEPTLFPVGQKISWVSGRQTTRSEDLSYCLLGILNVNMPLLYGEGTRAFTRLQEEVLKNGTDATIFAWPSSALPADPYASRHISILAPSPAVFREARYIQSSSASNIWTITNRGLRIEGLPIVEGPNASNLLTSAGFPPHPDNSYTNAIALIRCWNIRPAGKGEKPVGQVGIAMHKRNDIYYRLRTPESLLPLDSGIKMSASLDCIINLISFDSVSNLVIKWSKSCNQTCILREVPEKRFGFDDFKIFTRNRPDINVFLEADGSNSAADPLTKAVTFSNGVTAETFCVMVGFNYFATPYIHVAQDLIKDANDLPDQELCFDHVSYIMQDSKVVMASVVRGVKDGNRVYFLDVCMQDSV